MAVYIFLFILAFSGYAFNVNKNNKRRWYYLFIVFSAILFVAMFRNKYIGTDLRLYYNKYFPFFKNESWRNLQSVTISGDWEWGFCAFCKIIGQISTNIQCFIIFTSIFSIVPYALFIYKNSEDVVFSTVFFIGYHIFMMSLNIVRQAMAVGIILVGLESLKRKQYIKFMIYILIASLFHTSAIISILLIVSDLLIFSKNIFWLLGGATIVFSVIYRVIVEKLLQIPFLSRVYSIYSILGTGDSGGYITYHTLGMFFIALAILLWSYVVFDNREQQKRTYFSVGENRHILILQKTKVIIRKIRSDMTVYWSESMLIYAAYFAVLFRLSAFIINVTARFALYFIPFLMILFPHACGKFQNIKVRKIVIFAAYVIITVFFLFIGFTRAGTLWGTVPYQFFWSNRY